MAAHRNRESGHFDFHHRGRKHDEAESVFSDRHVAIVRLLGVCPIDRGGTRKHQARKRHGSAEHTGSAEHDSRCDEHAEYESAQHAGSEPEYARGDDQ